jgi:Meiotically up-regulated gene 113
MTTMLGYVYIIARSAEGPVKIGLTGGDTEFRCRRLNTGNPHDLNVFNEVLHADPARIKGLVHRCLADRRSRDKGEWYDLGVPEAIDVVSDAVLMLDSCLLMDWGQHLGWYPPDPEGYRPLPQLRWKGRPVPAPPVNALGKLDVGYPNRGGALRASVVAILQRLASITPAEMTDDDLAEWIAACGHARYTPHVPTRVRDTWQACWFHARCEQSRRRPNPAKSSP